MRSQFISIEIFMIRWSIRRKVDAKTMRLWYGTANKIPKRWDLIAGFNPRPSLKKGPNLSTVLIIVLESDCSSHCIVVLDAWDNHKDSRSSHLVVIQTWNRTVAGWFGRRAIGFRWGLQRRLKTRFKIKTYKKSECMHTLGWCRPDCCLSPWDFEWDVWTRSRKLTSSILSTSFL